MHPASPTHSFLPPIFSLAREKIGPPEARQKRPRRNEPPQATSLILCARFFLSKPQTEFAVWVFLCKSATTSQSRLRRASIPTPFVPSGHFPLIGGIGPWKGSLCPQQLPLRKWSKCGTMTLSQGKRRPIMPQTYGFEQTRERRIPELGAVLHEYTHAKSGARLCWLCLLYTSPSPRDRG